MNVINGNDSNNNNNINRSVTIKIWDFDLSRCIVHDSDSNMELEIASEIGSNQPGKPLYMAPEIYAGIPFNGTIADIWSLGVILFQC